MVMEEQGEYNQPLLHCVFYCFGWNKGSNRKLNGDYSSDAENFRLEPLINLCAHLK
ncbi:hypothetical protein Hdeb2414_s0491g00904721 [Helianthus debilis subsp. tardiflorus]